MSADSPLPVLGSGDEFIVLLSPRELQRRYADAAAQLKLLKQLLRLSAQVSARRTEPVSVPVRLRATRRGEQA